MLCIYTSVITTSFLLVLLLQLTSRCVGRINFIQFSSSLHPKHKMHTSSAPTLLTSANFKYFHCCTAIYASNKQHSSYSTTRWLEKPHYLPTEHTRVVGVQVCCYSLFLTNKETTIKMTDKQIIKFQSEIQCISSQMKVLKVTQKLIREFLFPSICEPH